MSELLRITINGEKMELEVDPSITLLDLLREKLFLTGTKKGCGKGECGACTVIMDGMSVNSCLVPVLKAMDTEVETIEALNRGGKLHPIQQAYVDAGAVQCGFCIPGMVMSTKALLDVNDDPTRDEVKEALGGNICRCTGYVKIEKAVMAAAEAQRKGK